MKTSELTGLALDWAVDKAQGKFCLYPHGDYSSNWAQGGPIIERERFVIEPWGLHWVASVSRCILHHGPTPLIAAMRCYVASKMGDEIDIPEELA